MNLINCPSCKKEVSKKALACPHCGHQFKTPGGINFKEPVHLIGIITIILIIGLVVLGIITSLQ